MNGRSRLQTNNFLPPSLTAVQPGILQRKCASCGNHTVAADRCDGCKNKNGSLRRRPANDSAQTEVPPIVHEVLHSSGQPLDQSAREFFEPRFARSFSSVPVSSAARHLSQSSLTIGEPADVYEQEAARAADSLKMIDSRGGF